MLPGFMAHCLVVSCLNVHTLYTVVVSVLVLWVAWSMMTSLLAQGGILVMQPCLIDYESTHCHAEASQGLFNLLIHF
jgi:hypothetical protein